MTQIQKVVDEAEVVGSGHGYVWRRLVHTTIRLLAEGRPIEAAEIADASGIPLDEVEQALAGMSDVERDEAGRIVGMGLTMRPTPHVMRIDGKTLYAWCAMDTLAFASILDWPVTIESPDHASGEPIRIEADGHRVRAAEPATAVVSWWVDPAGEGLRGTLCGNGHFFASADSAAGWLAERPGASVLTLEAAFAAGRRMVFEALGESGAVGAAS